MSLEEFAEKHLDRMWTPGLPEESQCSGWKCLKRMVLNSEELTEWNLVPFHSNLKPFLIANWEEILKIRINSQLQAIKTFKKFYKES